EIAGIDFLCRQCVKHECVVRIRTVRNMNVLLHREVRITEMEGMQKETPGSGRFGPQQPINAAAFQTRILSIRREVPTQTAPAMRTDPLTTGTGCMSSGSTMS